MELLARCYGSSSDDDHQPSEDEEPHRDVASSADSHAVASSIAVRAVPAVHDTARKAIAQMYAHKATQAAHRETREERRYQYTPYRPRQRPSTGRLPTTATAVDRARQHGAEFVDPLFATFRAAPQHKRRRREGSDSFPHYIPRRKDGISVVGHTGAISNVQWNPVYPPLFLSASMDHTVRIWSMPQAYYENDPTVAFATKAAPALIEADSMPMNRRVFSTHATGVKSAKWSSDGRHTWSAGYDGQLAYMDAEISAVVHQFDHKEGEHVSAICVHPTDPSMALFGTSTGRILLRDLRQDAAEAIVCGFAGKGELYDLLFLPASGSEWSFVSSSELTSQETSHRTLLVWDFRARSIVADRLQDELCAFQSLRLHPSGETFVAQSTVNQAVIFAARPPYKRLKSKKTFSGSHLTAGYRIDCSFNVNGSLFASGSNDGRVAFYSCASQQKIGDVNAFGASTPCTVAEFHPRWQSTLLCGGYDGRMLVYDASSRA